MKNRLVQIFTILLFFHYESDINAFVNQSHQQQNTQEDNIQIEQLNQIEWQDDFTDLYNKLNRLHPNPWRNLSAKKFKDELKVVANQSEKDSRMETSLKLMRTVASITEKGRDGHTNFWPFQSSNPVHLLPIQLYNFSNEIFIVDADQNLKSLVGQKVLKIGGFTVDEALKKVSPFISKENEYRTRLLSSGYLIITELLEMLNISGFSTVDILTEDSFGKKQKTVLKPVTQEEYNILFPDVLRHSFLPVQSKELVTYNQIRQQKFYFKVLNQTALYMQYNKISETNYDGENFINFLQRLDAELQIHQLQGMILDLRFNQGGNGEHYMDFLEFLNRVEELDRKLDLYVLIGRGTYSTAMNLVQGLDHRANVHFLGEPTGGSPDRYGDDEIISLENSGINIKTSTRYLKKTTSSNDLSTFQPDYLINLSANQYFNGTDPVLDKALTLIELNAIN